MVFDLSNGRRRREILWIARIGVCFHLLGRDGIEIMNILTHGRHTSH